MNKKNYLAQRTCEHYLKGITTADFNKMYEATRIAGGVERVASRKLSNGQWIRVYFDWMEPANESLDYFELDDAFIYLLK